MARKLTALLLCSCLLLTVGAGLVQAEDSQPTPTYSWPIGQAMPRFSTPAEQLDAINFKPLSFYDQVAAASLQGLVNREQPRILFLDGEADANGWPRDLGLDFTIAPDWMDLILKYKSLLNGLVVFNPAVPETVNIATTAAGIEGCLAVSPELAAQLAQEPYSLPVVNDLNQADIADKAQAYDYLYRVYWPQCTRRAIFGLAPDGHIPLRDLAVAVNGVVLWLNPGNAEDKAIIQKFFQDAKAIDTYYLGWWPSEGDGVGFASQYGVMTIASDFYRNSTIYSALSREITVPTVPAKPELQDDKIYISLNYSDGDNIQYNQGAMRGGNLWGNPQRGQVPIGWTCSPALLDAGPQLLNYYYETATENDVLICGPTGLGYSTAHNWRSPADIAKYGDITNDYFERSGFNIITAWGWLTPAAANLYTRHIPSLLGMTMQDRIFSRVFHTATDVPVVWFGNDLPNGGAMSYDDGVENVRKQLSAIADANYLKGTQFYAAQFDAWKTPLHDIVGLVNDLNAAYPNRFVFVRPDHFMMLLNESQGKPFQTALRQSASASSNGEAAAQALDGSFSTGWQAGEAGESWLTVDLGKSYALDRYVLKNAATNYLDSNLNTRAWNIEVSENGTDGWKAIDCVSDNTDNIVYRNLPKTQARYIRILVTDAGADGIARIQEFEVYGSSAPACKTPSQLGAELPGKLAILYMKLYTLVNFIIGRAGEALRSFGLLG